ncbi:hypothetical protein C8P66_105159 [Humitalea rosea]|uniref:Uncharacterized protein n=1 Tax=Humitalea rosea TaxID=990373 RepID=A0A2W7IML6_9PROT|nr:hypothetical protein [Humitalea rosea]PZW48410.1 hypothetical protein C8P66_105159 [Humitalea rosea]
MSSRAPLLLLLLAGCAGGQDYERPGTWHATGVNDANLALMLAEPSHAERGVGAATDRADPGIRAVTQLGEGRRPPLPDSRASAIGAAPTAGGGGGR